MGKGNKAGFFKDVENRDPVLAGRLHTDFGTGVFGKPVSQLFEAIRKGREAGLPILCVSIGVSDTDAGIDPGFVDIKSTTDFKEDFKSQ